MPREAGFLVMRANGSARTRPDDRLREPIHRAANRSAPAVNGNDCAPMAAVANLLVLVVSLESQCASERRSPKALKARVGERARSFRSLHRDLGSTGFQNLP